MQTPKQKDHRLARCTSEQVTVAKMQRAIFKSNNVRNTIAQSAEAGKMQRTLLQQTPKDRKQRLTYPGPQALLRGLGSGDKANKAGKTQTTLFKATRA